MKKYITILFIILLIVGWCVFSALHRKDTKSLLPEDYSVYVKVDSAWDAINPIIDLQVADVVLSTPELASVKGALISFRQSPLRSNIFVDFVASRPVEVGVYMDEKTPNILGIVDLGVFSSVSRLHFLHHINNHLLYKVILTLNVLFVNKTIYL